MGQISNDSVSTTYVVPCDTGAAYHPWWRGVYLKLTCNLSSAHAVSETATPLGQRRKKNSKCEKVCHEKKRVACLASLVGVCPSCNSCTWAFDCPLCSLVFRSAAFSAPGDIHLLDLTYIPVPFVLPPPFECMFDVALPAVSTHSHTWVSSLWCVDSPCHMQLERSGVAHLEFSVLHVLVETVADDAGLSGTASPW